VSGAVATGNNWVVRRIMSKESEARNRIVLDLARNFFQAVQKREDWHPFAQLRTRKMKAEPSIPAFSGFKILRTRNPGSGRDPDQMRVVMLEVTLGGTEQVKLQTVPAEVLAVREVDWEPCKKCDGEGHTEEEEVCSKCSGTGKIMLQPPRMPERGTETYDQDDEFAEWGICPTSFRFSQGERRLVKL